MKQYEKLGMRIRFYREKKGLSINEAAKAIGIDRTHLSRLENGHDKPSESLFFRLMEFFEINDQSTELLDFASLAGYYPKVIVKKWKEVNKPTMIDSKNPDTGKQPINQIEVSIPPDTKPVLYTDSVFITRTQYGIVFDFAQVMGSSNKQVIVSRIGMSEQHAVALLKVLDAKIKEENKNITKKDQT